MNTLDLIRLTRNKVVNEGIHRWSKVTSEHILAWKSPESRPPSIRKSFSVIVAVCRDASGKDLRTKTRTLPHLSPTVGEAQAALLAVSEAALGQTIQENFDR